LDGKKIYFASDFHLGAPDYETSLAREKKVVAWLEKVRHDAAEIFLVGDIFDFWFEYKHAVPRGYTRLLGKISEITDSGVPVHWFTGNHDMWIFDYLPQECGVTIHHDNVEREWSGKSFFIGHGDGLGPGDYGYKVIRKIFRNRICQWLFARLHPNFGIWLARSLSGYSRKSNIVKDQTFLGEDNEWLISYCREKLAEKHYDFLVFGHRHLVIDYAFEGGARYINLGEWLNGGQYGVFDGSELRIVPFEGQIV
jgi:UDP-2,3-diacylglucosamine hydrolase